MILNITYLGRSADYPVDAVEDLADEDVRRVAIEVVRAGGVDGGIVEISDDAFVNYVIDRMVDRIYLRPKVPFGAIVTCEHMKPGDGMGMCRQCSQEMVASEERYKVEEQKRKDLLHAVDLLNKHGLFGEASDLYIRLGDMGIRR